MCVLVVGGHWVTLVRGQHDRLEELRVQQTETAPGLARVRQARKNWELFRPYLAHAAEGARQSYLRILHEITRLFPDRDDAYVTELVIATNTQGRSATDRDISITGNVRQGEVVTAFIERLNNSRMFQEAKQGALTQVPDDTYYPFSFSVKCNLRREPTKP